MRIETCGGAATKGGGGGGLEVDDVDEDEDININISIPSKMSSSMITLVYVQSF